MNRQGNDVGTQYRTSIFYHNDEQKREAEKIIAELEADDAFAAPIVTEVTELGTFYPAEDYHENYYARNPENPYCQAVISPKLAKFRKTFAGMLKD